MVYDCIPFFNELDILKLRMQIMAPFVDKFVLEESTVTFSGEPKPMIFANNREMFREFEDKIIYVAVDNSPMSGVTTHERDKFQKNQLIKGMGECKPEDIIIFSDVDEIPNPKILERIFENFDPEKVYHLAQRMFYCFLNMEEVSGNLLRVTPRAGTTCSFPVTAKPRREGAFCLIGDTFLTRKQVPEAPLLTLDGEAFSLIYDNSRFTESELNSHPEYLR